MGVDEWAIQNYFFAVRDVAASHNEFRQSTGIGGAMPLQVIDDNHYLSEEQALELRTSLARIRKNNEHYGMRIDYNWSTDLNAYYCSAKIPSADSKCDFPYSRLDIQPSGLMSFCGRFARRLSPLACCKTAELWSRLSQFSEWCPSCLTPFTRAMPAASSGLRRPASAAS